jgi:hypothetical protein
MGEIKKLAGKDEREGPLVRRWNAWEDNIKSVLRK